MSFSTILNVTVVLFLFSNRIPEAAFMARTYLPSQVSRIVSLWRNDLKKVSHPMKCDICDVVYVIPILYRFKKFLYRQILIIL